MARVKYRIVFLVLSLAHPAGERSHKETEKWGEASCLGIEERRDTRDRRGKKVENSGGMDARLSECVCMCVRGPKKKTLDSFAWARERKLHLHREEGKGVIKAGRWPAEESFLMPLPSPFLCVCSAPILLPSAFLPLDSGKFFVKMNSWYHFSLGGLLRDGIISGYLQS